MPFATRIDLLARSNARRLAQLAIPADIAMPPDDALRVAISGGTMGDFTQADQDAIELGLDAIDKALADANALILTYGIPATVQTTLLARLTSTIALYYLQGAERMTDDVQRAYDGAIATLKSHARGEINLIPADPTATPIVGDVITITSNTGRYRVNSDVDNEFTLDQPIDQPFDEVWQ